MKIYFSGIGGVGIGPLAEIALDAGYQVTGSDLAKSPITRQLEKRDVKIYFLQDGSDLSREHTTQNIDWFVHTAALPEDHPELEFARKNGIKTSKRDELVAKIIRDKNLKLIAVAGTHGKTTTAGMLIWALKELGVPTSYSIGTTLSFGPSGKFDPSSEYFIYECDEFDRNFLHFSPHLSLISSIGYDHTDTYPTEIDYKDAFTQFIEQSGYSLLWEKDLRSLKQADIPASYEAYDDFKNLSHIQLAGAHNRQNAFLVENSLKKLTDASHDGILNAINSFPGTSRRFEKLSDNLYSDYGHHPDEIKATLQMASELSNDITLVYQPHQNIRQHEIRDQYTDEVFENANYIYWLPTYLSRENPSLEILEPRQLASSIDPQKIEFTEMSDELWKSIQQRREGGSLVLCMGAGSIDEWARKQTRKLN